MLVSYFYYICTNSRDSAHYNDFAHTYKIVDANRHLPIGSTITCSITMLARATIVAVFFLAPHTEVPPTVVRFGAENG